MVRTVLITVIVLAMAHVVVGRSPDELPNSPIPPLYEKVQQAVPAAALPMQLDMTVQRTQQTYPLPFTANPAQPQTKKNVAADFGPEKLAIWTSAEMHEARTAIEEFCRLSARTSPAEGERFLEQLATLTPHELRDWLGRFQERRLGMELQLEAEQLSRQLMLSRALSRQEAMRQAYENIKYLRSQATETGEPSYMDQQTQRLQAGRIMQGQVAVAACEEYDPLDATTDPMNPRGYRRQVAGAMTLPGDLPRSDPRNYKRHAADYGEWATSRDAQPPEETTLENLGLE